MVHSFWIFCELGLCYSVATFSGRNVSSRLFGTRPWRAFPICKHKLTRMLIQEERTRADGGYGYAKGMTSRPAMVMV